MTTPDEDLAPCAGCGALQPGGERGCQANFERLLLRDFSDVRFFRVHRTMVDAYCLQHPARYCASTKSLAAHLCGLAAAIDGGGSFAQGETALQRFLDGTSPLTKPELPARRGDVTICSLDGIDDPAAHAAAVTAWAKSVWTAHAALHTTAREWLENARAAARRRGR